VKLQVVRVQAHLFKWAAPTVIGVFHVSFATGRVVDKAATEMHLEVS